MKENKEEKKVPTLRKVKKNSVVSVNHLVHQQIFHAVMQIPVTKTKLCCSVPGKNVLT